MFPRIATPMVAQAASAHAPPIHTPKTNDEGKRTSFLRPLVLKETYLSSSENKFDGGHHRDQNPLFPQLSKLVSNIVTFSKNALLSTTPEWPPFTDRSKWLQQVDIPILPKGYESQVALARITYPVASFRISILGPKYLAAMSILSHVPIASPSSTDSSWPETEYSLEEFSDVSSSDSWSLLVDKN